MNENIDDVTVRDFASLPPMKLISMLDESMGFAEQLVSVLRTNESRAVVVEMDAAISRCKAQVEEILPGVEATVPLRDTEGLTPREAHLGALVSCLIRAADADKMKSQWLLAELTRSFALIAGRLGDMYERAHFAHAEEDMDEALLS